MDRNSKLIAAVATAGALLLGACGSSGTGSAGTGGSSGSSTQKVSFTEWTWANNSQMGVTAYEKLHPNVHIDLTDVGGGSGEYTKLTTALSAGSGAPCLVQVEYDQLPSFESRPGLVNIAQYVSSYAKDFPKWVWAQVTKGSAVYGVPNDIGPVAYAYRPSIFTKYKLPIPKTWAQFATDAVTLHKDNPKMYLTYLGNDDSTLQGLTWQAGAQTFSESGGDWKVMLKNPTSEKVLAMWGALVKEGAIPIETLGSPAYGKAIASGEFASYVEAAWDPNYLGTFMVGAPVQQQMLLTQLPQWSTSGPPKSYNFGGSSLAVTNQCKDPAAAAAFAAWEFTSKAGQEISQGNGTLKPAQKGAGMGLFDAASTRASVSSFSDQTFSQFPGEKNLFQLFSKYSGEVESGFVWSPFETYIADTWPSLADNAAAGKTSFVDALSTLQSDTVTYAKQQGYKVSG
jgi:multiple sugar transport system substrate-binding protein